LRVPEEHEVQGLDLSQHGEEGYDWGHPVPVHVAAFTAQANRGPELHHEIAMGETRAVMGD